jgi:hypothetical protein
MPNQFRTILLPFPFLAANSVAREGGDGMDADLS